MATACNCGLAEKLQQAEDKIRDLEEKIIILNPPKEKKILENEIPNIPEELLPKSSKDQIKEENLDKDEPTEVVKNKEEADESKEPINEDPEVQRFEACKKYLNDGLEIYSLFFVLYHLRFFLKSQKNVPNYKIDEFFSDYHPKFDDFLYWEKNDDAISDENRTPNKWWLIGPNLTEYLKDEFAVLPKFSRKLFWQILLSLLWFFIIGGIYCFMCWMADDLKNGLQSKASDILPWFTYSDILLFVICYCIPPVLLKLYIFIYIGLSYFVQLSLLVQCFKTI